MDLNNQNRTKTQMKEGKKSWVNRESAPGTKKIISDCLIVARAYHPPGSLLPDAVDELRNDLNLYL